MGPDLLSLRACCRLFVALLAIVVAASTSACRPQPATAARAAAAAALPPYEPHPLGEPAEGRPWITHVAIVDLDQDGRLDVIACDAQANDVRWLRQESPGVLVERTISAAIAGPAHAATADVDGDGDWDVLVAAMGRILPTNDPIGSVVILENLGSGSFRQRVILENVARVTDVRGADLDNDGDIDLAVGQFGYVQGQVQVLRQVTPWTFEAESLLGLAGTIHVPVADFDGDGAPDVAALVSQEWEEVHVFDQRNGRFRDRVVWGSTNEDFGSSGLEVADLDRDGDPDLFYTNGDAFDYGRPGGRSWHGLQWLENRQGTFTYHRIGAFPGAFSPVAADLNGDGHSDLVTVSGFNAWEDPAAASVVAWLNDGRQQFRPVVIARRPTHLMALAVGDLDADGRPDLVTGGLHAYPPFDDMSRLTWWRQR